MLRHYGVIQKGTLRSKPFVFAIFSNEFDRDRFLESLPNTGIYKPVNVYPNLDIEVLEYLE